MTKMRARDVFSLVKEAAVEWDRHKATRLAASLAFYTMLSVAPLLVIAIAVAGLVFGEEAAQGQVVAQIEHLVGHAGAEVIQNMVAASRNRSSGIIAMIVGIVVLLVGSSGVFSELQDSLNTIWGVMPKPGRPILRVLRTRFLSFTMVLGLGFLLLVSLVISAGLAAIGDRVDGGSTLLAVGLHLLHSLVSFGVVTLLFAMIYRTLPDAKIPWRDVWLGAAVTSLLFTLGKLAIGFYLGRSTVASTYGAAGSFVVLLLWVYYSAQILFFGAEITQIFARRKGSGIVPDDDATLMTCDEEVSQGVVATGRPAPPRSPSLQKPSRA